MKKTILTLMVLFLGIFLIGFQNAVACGYPGCGPCPGTGTPGYWKNHPEAWNVETITIGGVTYTKDEAIAIMQMPVKGDKTLTMFPAAVAAALNVIEGCEVPHAYYYGGWNNCLYDANDWLMNNPVGTGVRANSEAWQHSHGEAIYFCLDDYNNGWLGEPSRDSLE